MPSSECVLPADLPCRVFQNTEEIWSIMKKCMLEYKFFSWNFIIVFSVWYMANYHTWPLNISSCRAFLKWFEVGWWELNFQNYIFLVLIGSVVLCAQLQELCCVDTYLCRQNSSYIAFSPNLTFLRPYSHLTKWHLHVFTLRPGYFILF